MFYVSFLQTLLVFFIARKTLAATCAAPEAAGPSNFAAISFDYIVIGGGTAGVALSARLAEDASVIVGVIEAGALHLNDPVLDIPVSSGVGNATYDWQFVTIPQVYAGDRTLSVPRGKLLGGSSGINGMAWNRGTAAEYDAWAELAGDTNWGWPQLLPFMKKSESFAKTPTDTYPGISAQDAVHVEADLSHVDGFDGPTAASLNEIYFDTVTNVAVTLNNLGIQTNAEPQGGNTTGVSNIRLSLDREQGVRSYATTYYCQNAEKPNYHVLTNASATRIVFSNSSAEGLTAVGVEFSFDGRKYTASASKEVILAAGTIQTPQLLELSGIGNSSILESYGIQTLVDLPGVGEQLQEHLFVATQWQLQPGIETFDALRNNATFAAEQAAQYASNRTGLLAATDSLTAFIPLQDIVSEDRFQELLGIFEKEANATGLSDVQQQQYKFQQEWLARRDVPAVELILWSKGLLGVKEGESYATMLGGLMHPMSRGSVHIASNNPFAPPAINPNFLSKDFDTQVLLDVLKFTQKLARTAPFSGLVAVQNSPDLSMQTDEDLIAYIRAGAAGGDHVIGTASLAPRAQGGVVDGSLKVYGTTNLRIVDASMFPIQIGAHTQATVYAIAEKAAELILST